MRCVPLFAGRKGATIVTQSISPLRQAYAALNPLIARLYAVPLLGYVLRTVVAFAKLPRINMHVRRIDTIVQQLEARVAMLEGRPGAVGGSRLDVLSNDFSRVLEAVTASQTALRTLRRDDAPTPAVMPVAPAAPWIDPQIEVLPEVQLRREPPRSLNRLPRLSDWALDSPLARHMAELR